MASVSTTATTTAAATTSNKLQLYFKFVNQPFGDDYANLPSYWVSNLMYALSRAFRSLEQHSASGLFRDDRNQTRVAAAVVTDEVTMATTTTGITPFPTVWYSQFSATFKRFEYRDAAGWSKLGKFIFSSPPTSLRVISHSIVFPPKKKSLQPNGFSFPWKYTTQILPNCFTFRTG